MSQSDHLTFDDQIKQVLKSFHEPERLAAESPLATAYFLSGALQRSDQPRAWADLLQQEVLGAADSLWGENPPSQRETLLDQLAEIVQQPGSGRYHYIVLELRYFNRFVRPRATQDIWEEYLRQSRAEFYRDLNTATTALGERLLARLRPTGRLDAPPTLEGFIGRTSLVDLSLHALAKAETVGLDGPSGAGKTTLAAAIAKRWPTTAIFWFTVRPALNDDLHHLLHALAYFFTQHGESRLWRLLMANAGRADDLNLILGMARADCAALAQPLLCIDEADVWQDPARPVWRFLAGLAEETALLLIGQRVPAPTAHRFTVGGFSVDETATLLAAAGIRLSATELDRLHERTGGNPRLLWLSSTLLQRGESLDDLLADGTPFQLYLTHLWERLSPAERSLLQSLSVFHAAAPADAWDAAVLAELAARHLLLTDDRGGVSLLPSLRSAVEAELSVELRERLHAQAAVLYGERGEATLAAYHFHLADQPQAAIHAWFAQRGREIRRGQAATARAIFNNISLARVPAREQKALRLIRAELHQLLGEAQAGLADLESEDWAKDEQLVLYAQRLRGDFLDALGVPDAAVSAYDAALSTAARLLQESTDLHVRRGMVHVRQRNVNEAWQAARLARYAAEQLHGLVQEARRNLDEALVHYESALSLAQQLDHEHGLAETHRCLSKVYGMRGDLVRSVHHADAAITFYERIGDHVAAMRVRSNLAANYLDARQFAKVIEISTPALSFFQQVQHAHGIAATASNLAEAHFELGDHTQARAFAQLALQQEEPLAIPYALYTLGLIAHAEDNLPEAQHFLEQCRLHAERNADKFIEAHACLKLAEVLYACHRLSDSQSAAEQAVLYFEQLGIADMAEQARALAER